MPFQKKGRKSSGPSQRNRPLSPNLEDVFEDLDLNDKRFKTPQGRSKKPPVVNDDSESDVRESCECVGSVNGEAEKDSKGFEESKHDTQTSSEDDEDSGNDDEDSDEENQSTTEGEEDDDDQNSGNEDQNSEEESNLINDSDEDQEDSSDEDEADSLRGSKPSRGYRGSSAPPDMRNSSNDVETPVRPIMRKTAVSDQKDVRHRALQHEHRMPSPPFVHINVSIQIVVREPIQNVVYICESARGIVKIGISSKPEARMQGIRNCKCGCNLGRVKLVKIFDVPYPRRVELLAHKELENFQWEPEGKKKHKEWFTVSPKDAIAAVDRWMRFFDSAYEDGVLLRAWDRHIQELDDEMEEHTALKEGEFEEHHTLRNDRLNRWLERGPKPSPKVQDQVKDQVKETVSD